MAVAKHTLPLTGPGGYFTFLNPIIRPDGTPEPVKTPVGITGAVILYCTAGYKTPPGSLLSYVEEDPNLPGILFWNPERLDCLPDSDLLLLPTTNTPGAFFQSSSSAPFYPGDTAFLQCPLGFTAPASNRAEVVVTPANKLAWEPGTLDCTPIQCDAPRDLLYGRPSIRIFEFPKYFHYECDPGYLLHDAGKNMFFCDVNGNWTPPIPNMARCDPVTCPAIPIPEHGSVQGGSTYQDTARLTCDPGYVLRVAGQLQGGSGVYERVCRGDGTWSGTDDVVCEPLPCPPLEGSPKVLFALDPLTTLDCGGGRTVTLRCRSNGTWSLLPPYCGGIVAPNVGNPRIIPGILPGPQTIPGNSPSPQIIRRRPVGNNPQAIPGPPIIPPAIPGPPTNPSPQVNPGPPTNPPKVPIFKDVFRYLWDVNPLLLVSFILFVLSLFLFFLKRA